MGIEPDQLRNAGDMVEMLERTRLPGKQSPGQPAKRGMCVTRIAADALTGAVLHALCRAEYVFFQ